MNTLLEMVQGILSSQDGDVVNSISDTEESMQAMFAVRDSYEFIVTSDSFRETKNLLQIDSSSDSELPLVMNIRQEIDNIDYLKYNKFQKHDPDDRYEHVTFLSVQDFMHRSTYQIDEPYMQSMTLPEKFNSIVIHYRTDCSPSYFCMLDNKTLLFDSIDLEVDDTIQNSKILAYGTFHHNFIMQDDFDFPNLTHQTKLIIYNEAKRQASVEQRQIDNPIALSRARKLQIGGDRNRRRIGKYTYGVNDPYVDHGRKGHTGNSRTRNGSSVGSGVALTGNSSGRAGPFFNNS